MQKIKQNIWLLYQALLVSGLMIFTAFFFNEYQNVKNEFKINQASDVNLLTRGIYSHLVSIEGTLDIVGHHVAKLSGNIEEQAEELNNSLSYTKQISALGIIDKNGVIGATTDNVKVFRGFNMNSIPITKKTFNEALQNKKMIIGETYFHQVLKKLVIPVRKSIIDNNNNFLFVVSAVIPLDNFLFGGLTSSNELSSPVMLISKNKNMIYQFSSKFENMSHEEKKQYFHTERRITHYDSAVNQLAEQKHTTIEYLMNTDDAHLFLFSNPKDGLKYQVTARYDSSHGLWIVSKVNVKNIWIDTINKVSISLISFLIFNVIFYFLVLSIAKSDSKKRAQLIHQANHDSLTGLPNRFSLRKNELQWTTSGNDFSVIFIDLDKFKNINDTHGHKTGDNILVQVSSRLKSLLNKGSVLHRESGDEFIVLTKSTDTSMLIKESKDAIAAISKPYDINGTKFVIGASIGIAKFPDHGCDIETLIKSADIAMYKAKINRNSVKFFDSTLEKELVRKISIEQRLREAIVDKKIFMVYQPQVDASEDLYGVEALVRWHDDKGLGFVSPDEFINVAEDSGMMPILGAYIINAVMEDINKIKMAHGKKFQTSINISVKQIMCKNFYQVLTDLIMIHQFDTSSLTLEITETLFVECVDEVKDILTKIKKLGIKISLDDFGTGYSSLSMLNKFDIDELKIDRSFIMSISENEKNLKMVQNIISIGKNLEMKVLAEGVETKTHQEELERFNCDLYQGYYFSKPLSIVDFEDFLYE